MGGGEEEGRIGYCGVFGGIEAVLSLSVVMNSKMRRCCECVMDVMNSKMRRCRECVMDIINSKTCRCCKCVIDVIQKDKHR